MGDPGATLVFWSPRPHCVVMLDSSCCTKSLTCFNSAGVILISVVRMLTTFILLWCCSLAVDGRGILYPYGSESRDVRFLHDIWQFRLEDTPGIGNRDKWYSQKMSLVCNHFWYQFTSVAKNTNCKVRGCIIINTVSERPHPTDARAEQLQRRDCES